MSRTDGAEHVQHASSQLSVQDLQDLQFGQSGLWLGLHTLEWNTGVPITSAGEDGHRLLSDRPGDLKRAETGLFEIHWTVAPKWLLKRTWQAGRVFNLDGRRGFSPPTTTARRMIRFGSWLSNLRVCRVFVESWAAREPQEEKPRHRIHGYSNSLMRSTSRRY